MMVKDKNGKYEMKVDTRRRIVYEKNTGMWIKGDLDRQKEEYKAIVNELNKFGKKPWAKVCDLTEYRMSNVGDDVSEFVKWCVEKGYTHCAFVLPKSVIVKMQMNRAIKDGVVSNYFDNVQDAEKWLGKEGF